MAKVNPEAFKLPESIEKYLDESMGREGYDEVIERVKRMDPKFDAEGARSKLKIYEEHIKGVDEKNERAETLFKTKELRNMDLFNKGKREQISGERLRLRDELKKRAAEFEKKYKGLDDKEEKLKAKWANKNEEAKKANSERKKPREKLPGSDYDSYSAFRYSKDKMCGFLDRQKDCCSKLERELNSIQSKLDNFDFTGSALETHHKNLMEDTAGDLDNIIKDFHLLEKEVRTNLANDGITGIDESENYEEDLGELRRLQQETEKKLGFNLDI